MGRTGVMVCGHGSRDEAACDEFRHVVGRIAAALPEWPVAMGYLEFARPIIRDGLDRCALGASTACSPCPACCSRPGTSRTTCRRC